MHIRRSVLLPAALLAAGCHKALPKEVSLGAAFHTIPLPPRATALAREGGTDAMQFILITPVVPDSVLDFYRNVLSTDPFHLVNERSSGSNTTAMYAEQENGPPIWITIAPNGREGSQVTIAGAKDSDRPDSLGKLRTADSGAAASLPPRKP